MGAPNCNAKVELKKGPWTREEDQKLLSYIEGYGHGSWRTLPAKAGLQRCGKSCRLRWTNYLRPDIRRGRFTTHEEKTIIRLHALLGNRWSTIAAHLPKRTDNEIKNYWNTRLKKRLTRMGIDPATHKPRAGPAQSSRAATLSHMAQWETARLEAEARLGRHSKLGSSNLQLLRRLAAARPPHPPPQMAAPPCLDVLRVWQEATTTIPSCFFSSLGSHTSTLNVSCSSSLTVPTVSPAMANDVVSMNYNCGACGAGLVDSYMDMGGKTENSVQLHDDSIVYPVGYDFDLTGPMDLAALNQDSHGYDMAGPAAGEFEDIDCKNYYWKELLNLVSSPMESPTL